MLHHGPVSSYFFALVMHNLIGNMQDCTLVFVVCNDMVLIGHTRKQIDDLARTLEKGCSQMI